MTGQRRFGGGTIRGLGWCPIRLVLTNRFPRTATCGGCPGCQPACGEWPEQRTEVGPARPCESTCYVASVPRLSPATMACNPGVKLLSNPTSQSYALVAYALRTLSRRAPQKESSKDSLPMALAMILETAIGHRMSSITQWRAPLKHALFQLPRRQAVPNHPSIREDICPARP